MQILNDLVAFAEPENAAFQAKLTPGIPEERFLGVRVPKIREIEKKYRNTPDREKFLRALPHNYYDENILHSVFISNIKDYDEALGHLKKFLSYIDNWAVCDTIKLPGVKKHRTEFLEIIKEWIRSEHTYTCRLAIDMLMTYYLDEYFDPQYPEMVAAVHSGEYYVKMMVAWYFATALAKQWETSITYIENNVLDIWTHNKTIQKAIESYRITEEQKKYLRTLKRIK